MTIDRGDHANGDDRNDRVAVPPLLSIAGLEVRYRSRRGAVDAVRGVDLTLAAGETLALVGESGSGKSTTAHAVAGLLPPAAAVTGGRIDFDGSNLVGIGERRLRALRGRSIGLVPQDPTVSLNRSSGSVSRWPKCS